jgi:hypothetical protein
MRHCSPGWVGQAGRRMELGQHREEYPGYGRQKVMGSHLHHRRTFNHSARRGRHIRSSQTLARCNTFDAGMQQVAGLGLSRRG